VGLPLAVAGEDWEPERGEVGGERGGVGGPGGGEAALEDLVDAAGGHLGGRLGRPGARDLAREQPGEPADGRVLAGERSGAEPGRFDESQPREVAVYSEVLDANRGKIVTDEVLVVEGKVSNDDFSGGLRIVAERLLSLGEARSRFARALQVRINGEVAASGGALAAAGKLQTLLEPFREGGCPVRVNYRNAAAEAELPLGDGWRVRLDDALLESLRDWLAPEAVEIVYPN